MGRATLAPLLLALVACGAATRSRPARVAEESARCRDLALGVQVLGSGGPIAEDGRASSGYLVWIDGHARLLVDAGPGTVLRLGESGARLEDLDALLLTHLHVDHAGDVAGLLKSASFGPRRAPLPVVGPTAGAGFPGLSSFLAALFAQRGAFPYLGGYLEAGRPFALQATEVDVSRAAAAEVLRTPHARIRAVGVPHGPVPALAYEIAARGRRIAFMGDQRADERRYVDMIRGVEVLVAHMAIGPRTGGVAARLHATPARLGVVAAEAGVGTLVLSHLMRRARVDLDGNLASIRQRFEGPVLVAEDGLCVPAR